SPPAKKDLPPAAMVSKVGLDRCPWIAFSLGRFDCHTSLPVRLSSAIKLGALETRVLRGHRRRGPPCFSLLPASLVYATDAAQVEVQATELLREIRDVLK